MQASARQLARVCARLLLKVKANGHWRGQHANLPVARRPRTCRPARPSGPFLVISHFHFPLSAGQLIGSANLQMFASTREPRAAAGGSERDDRFACVLKRAILIHLGERARTSGALVFISCFRLDSNSIARLSCAHWRSARFRLSERSEDWPPRGKKLISLHFGGWPICMGPKMLHLRPPSNCNCNCADEKMQIRRRETATCFLSSSMLGTNLAQSLEQTIALEAAPRDRSSSSSFSQAANRHCIWRRRERV